jgi:hypothetical protein
MLRIAWRPTPYKPTTYPNLLLPFGGRRFTYTNENQIVKRHREI